MLERMWNKENEHSSIAGGNANLYNQFGNQYGDFSENWESTYLRLQQCHSLEYTQKMLILLQKHLFNYVHSSTICNRAWRQPRCPATEE